MNGQEMICLLCLGLLSAYKGLKLDHAIKRFGERIGLLSAYKGLKLISEYKKIHISKQFIKCL